MALGLILAEWNNQLGSVIKAISPKGFQISRDILNKVLMTHCISSKDVPEIMEIHVNNQIILSFACKSHLTIVDYGILILVLNETEEPVKNKLKDDLKNIGKKLKTFTGFKKIQEFRSYANKFFEKKYSRKIMLIGPSNVGKTTLKKLFFEGISQDQLLNVSSEPTIGIEYYNYEWFDLKLGIADLAGQEIHDLLSTSEDFDSNLFEGTDVILFMFDVQSWTENSDALLDLFKKILDLANKYVQKNKISVFCHKIDLIPQNLREDLQKKVNQFFSQISLNNIYFSSIKDDFLHDLIKNLQLIISSISIKMEKIVKIVNASISKHSSTAVFLFNQNKLMLYISSNNFPLVKFKAVKELYITIHNFFGDFKDRTSPYQISSKKIATLVVPLGISNNEIFIFISLSLSMNKLIELNDEIQKSIINLDTDYFSEKKPEA
jgi:GTPase SAR1 family protein